MSVTKIPYSILDLATVLAGKTPADSFKSSLDLAQHAEQLNYKRIWFAEHHNMISVASSATAVLIGYIAGGTKTIRVGSGGIMLPNHAPLIVAEQFGTLESLYPGRIDLGLGRAPGTDQTTAYAIRGENFYRQHNFGQDIATLKTLFSAENATGKVRAIPGEGLDIPIWILGSSTDSAYLAAEMGLPYAFASHFAPTYLMQALKIYRDNFKPSAVLSEPYTLACVNVVAADTDAEAEHLATSLKVLFKGIVTGKRQLLQPPVESLEGILTPQEEYAAQQLLTYSFIGGRAKIRTEVSAFLKATGINEIMAATYVYDHGKRIYSYKLFADMMNGIA
ncbi:MAG TPA: LLM class flavin-dependent oxidoreductase [Chitinophagales bacterium]|nr:LLM class flavin-dependent oxidoreductase [Chitinophagales bacterium]